MLRDKDLREPLFEFLELTFGKVRIIEEKTMGKSRADVVMVTENGPVGVEIKSDADTYERLARQVKDYNKFFEFNIAAVGTKHAAHVAEHIPDWWGIITMEEAGNDVDCYLFRKPKLNPKAEKKPDFCLEKQLSFLWRSELLHIQQQIGMYKYASQSKDFVRKKILEKAKPEILKKLIVEELFERDYTKFEERDG